MDMRLADIAGWLEQLAPMYLAEEWDNVGLQVGSPTDVVTRVMTALSPSEAVVEQAIAAGVQLIVTHHPLIFKPLYSLRSDRPSGAVLSKLTKSGISLYAAHTNLDAAPHGLGQWVGETIGIREGQPLIRRQGDRLQKLVVYVPVAYAEAVRNALGESGAGHIGNYSYCSFAVQGTGSFKPGAGARPFIGQEGKIESVAEVRLETVLSASDSKRVIDAMLAVHPYEEVAYDLYDLALPSRAGYGFVGNLVEPIPFDAYLVSLHKQLQTNDMRIAGPVPRMVKRVAVVNGSGADFIDQAWASGADVFVTGDVGYHDAEKAGALGLCVIDAGHFATESIVSTKLAEYLQNCITGSGGSCEVLVAQECSPLKQLSRQGDGC